MYAAIAGALRRAVNVRDGEAAALVWSCAYFFFVFSAYYIIRPVRDEMGVAGGVENLAWLFTGTLIGMLLVHPIYTAMVARLPRRRFVPWTYRFFILNLLVFFFLFRVAGAEQSVWIGRVFFIWTSVFNLFVVSVFWSFMADLYGPNQSKRLFGVIAVGGTLGAVLGSSITSGLVGWLGPTNLLVISALLLEVAGRASNVLDRHEAALIRCAREDGDTDGDTATGDPAAATAGAASPRVGEWTEPEGSGIDGAGVPGSRSASELRSRREEVIGAGEPRSRGEEVIGGGILEGVRHVLSSSYLLGIAAFMMLYTVASTFLYFQQLDIVSRVFQDDPVGRTRLFANIDLTVNVLTLGLQIFATSRILKWFGVGLTLALLPLISLIGFGILGVAPVLAVVVVFQVLRRTGNFGLARPAREVLYTVLPRTDKFKAKNFNDTSVYRFGDQVGAWSYDGLAALGLGLSALAMAMVPISAAWLLLALWLGRQQGRLRAEREMRQRAREPAMAPAGSISTST